MGLCGNLSLISSGLRIHFDEMEGKNSVFVGSSIVGQDNRNNCVEAPRLLEILMFAMFLTCFKPRGGGTQV